MTINTLPAINPRGMKVHKKKNPTHRSTNVIVALFIVVKNCTQLKCPLVSEWLNKLW